MRVFVTQPIDSAGLNTLQDAGIDVEVRQDGTPIPREELLAAVAGCDGLLAMLTDPIDAPVLGAGPLKVVANHAVGVDNIDLAAARQRGVVVTNTPGVLTDATADLTWALLLACARHVVPGDHMMRQDRFTGWTPLLMRGLELRGATLGIIGMGRIGRAVAERAAGFGMEVLGMTSKGEVTLERLLSESDVVSLHCPLTEQTRGLIGAGELARMKPGAILLNTARGAVLDEEALADALEAGHLSAAGLDVHADEPRANPRLCELDNVVLLPHLGSATMATRRKMARMAAEDIAAVLRGEAPAHPV